MASPEAALRVADRFASTLLFAPLLWGCDVERASTDRPPPAAPQEDAACAQIRAELGGDPATLRAHRRTFRERATARFGAVAFAALRASYGGRCDDDADFRCALDEVGPFASVRCVSPTRHVHEELYADGATLRRAERSPRSAPGRGARSPA